MRSFYKKTQTHFIHYNSDNIETQMVLEEKIKTTLVIGGLLKIETTIDVEQTYGKKVSERKLGFN